MIVIIGFLILLVLPAILFMAGRTVYVDEENNILRTRQLVTHWIAAVLFAPMHVGYTTRTAIPMLDAIGINTGTWYLSWFACMVVSVLGWFALLQLVDPNGRFDVHEWELSKAWLDRVFNRNGRYDWFTGDYIKENKL